MNGPVETKQCTNCKLDILSHNYTIHSLHCIKNIYLCDKCNQPVNYNKKVDHDQTDHVVSCCSNCSIKLEKYLLRDHLENDCPHRKVKCQICNIEVTSIEISEHENYCGSRTEKCSECGEFVMLKYKSLHIDSNHTFIKLSDEPGPSPSWLNGRRTLYNFMPDLSPKTGKPIAIHKRKSNEFSERSRNSESNESIVEPSHDEAIKKNFDWFSSDKDKCQLKVESFAQLNDVKTPSRRSIDEWPALSSLRSLQISEEKENNLGGSEACNSSQNDDSDWMYAKQVSQELNSPIWFKEFNVSDEEVLKNSLKPLAENYSSGEKVIQKNMFDKSFKKGNMHSEVNVNKNNLDYFSEEQDIVKLPCEFCGTLIVSNELILHQSRCSLNVIDIFDRSARHRVPYFEDDEGSWEKKIACGICNKIFKASLLESHELHCRRNPSKLWKNQDKGPRNLRSMNVKSEPGIQNGVELNSPQLSRVGTRSEWLSELSKGTEARKDLKNNLNYPEMGLPNKTTKASRKNRRAPSPPRR